MDYSNSRVAKVLVMTVDTFESIQLDADRYRWIWTKTIPIAAINTIREL
jgi:hypothetical protein